VRSDTDDPCRLPAAVRIEGVYFCAGCAREQEAYFAIGELTEGPRSPQDDERLVGLLSRMRRIGAGRRAADTRGRDAAQGAYPPSPRRTCSLPA
jgi:hypothetical protein